MGGPRPAVRPAPCGGPKCRWGCKELSPGAPGSHGRLREVRDAWDLAVTSCPFFKELDLLGAPSAATQTPAGSGWQIPALGTWPPVTLAEDTVGPKNPHLEMYPRYKPTSHPTGCQAIWAIVEYYVAEKKMLPFVQKKTKKGQRKWINMHRRPRDAHLQREVQTAVGRETVPCLPFLCLLDSSVRNQKRKKNPSGAVTRDGLGRGDQGCSVGLEELLWGSC